MEEVFEEDMTCYSPLHGFKGPETAEGRSRILFKAPAGSERLDVPCGKCIGCRLDYSRGWAIRCMHEASLYENNCFVTLTYDDEHLPKDGNLHIEDFQKFVKRLRKEAFHDGIRYFHAGEYGGDLGRPHFHAILFNCDFADKVHASSRRGNRLYASEALSALWPFGFHSIGDVTLASASYVARYCMKKAEQPDKFFFSRRNFQEQSTRRDSKLIKSMVKFVSRSIRRCPGDRELVRVGSRDMERMFSRAMR